MSSPFPIPRVLAYLRENDITIAETDTIENFLIALKQTEKPTSPHFYTTFISGEDGPKTVTRFVTGGSLPKACSAEDTALLLKYFPLSTMRDQYKPAIGQHSKYTVGPGPSAHMLLPLMRWSKKNAERLAIVRLLLENDGLDPNGCLWYSDVESLPDGREVQHLTALHIAADRGDEEMVELLLEFGAVREMRDGKGFLPKERAAAKGHRRVVVLLEEGSLSEKEPEGKKVVEPKMKSGSKSKGVKKMAKAAVKKPALKGKSAAGVKKPTKSDVSKPPLPKGKTKSAVGTTRSSKSRRPYGRTREEIIAETWRTGIGDIW